MWPATKQSRKMNFWWVGVLLRSQPFNTNLNCDLKCDCCNCVYFAVTVTLFFWSWLYNPMKNLSFILKCVCVCSVCVYTHTRASGGMSVCLCTFTDISNMCSCCSARLVVCRPFWFFFCGILTYHEDAHELHLTWLFFWGTQPEQNIQSSIATPVRAVSETEEAGESSRCHRSFTSDSELQQRERKIKKDAVTKQRPKSSQLKFPLSLKSLH